jgi:hypothetical protein
MLLDAHSRPGLLRWLGLRVWENDRLAIGWRGHLYLPGHEAGPESTAALAARLEAVGPEMALGAASSPPRSTPI